MSTRDVLIVGHRASGKSALSKLAARALSVDLLDLDEEIERVEGRTCAQIVSEDEARFRELERTHLDRLLAEPSGRTSRIIVLGAGCQSIPPGAWCIWIWRGAWEHNAKRRRKRLRPQISFAQEVEWMRQTREPRWAAASHVRLDLSRASSLDEGAKALTQWISLLPGVQHGALTRKSWVVPAHTDEVGRAFEVASLMSAAGVEIRSDYNSLRILQRCIREGLPILSSLRTADDRWLRQERRGGRGDRHRQPVSADGLPRRRLRDAAPRVDVPALVAPPAS